MIDKFIDYSMFGVKEQKVVYLHWRLKLLYI